VLNFDGWQSLQRQSVAGWSEFSASNRLGELNLFESLTIPARSSLPLGNPYVPFAAPAFGVAEPGLKTLKFSYSPVGASSALAGDVEFSARNTLVLVIDPATGAAALENQSAFDVELDGYLVKSKSGVLDAVGWAPLATTDAAWTAGVRASNRVSEGNLFGASLLAAGGRLSLGNLVDAAQLSDEADVELEFSVVGFGSLTGGVQFAAAGAAASADFTGDGVVDGDDLAVWEGQFGSAGGSASGDVNGDGRVAGADLLAWQRQFAAGSGARLAAASVPEPQSIGLACCLLSALLSAGRARPRG
jgi:hypothetical protein